MDQPADSGGETVHGSLLPAGHIVSENGGKCGRVVFTDYPGGGSQGNIRTGTQAGMAVQYLSGNTRLDRQKKRCQNKWLCGIFAMFNA